MTLIGSGTITRKLVGSATLGTLSPTTTGGIEIDLLEGGDSSSSFTGESPATVQITVRKDTSANWSSNNPVLGESEIAHVTDTNQYVIGNGVDAFIDLPNTNYFASMDDLMTQIGNVSGSLAEIQSDISTLQTDLGLAETSIAGLTTSVSSLQTGVNNHESEITTLQSDVSTLQSDLTTQVSGLQGQIDTINTSLTDGLMKKYTLQLNLSEIDVNAESNIEIIIPTPSKAVMLLHSSVLIESDSLSAGQSAIRIKSENDINIFEDLIIDDTGSFVGLTLLKSQRDPATLSGVDGKVYLYITLGNTWAGANGVITLTILYMEV